MALKRIGILYHPLIEAAGKLAEKLGDFLTLKSVSVWTGSSWEAENARSQIPGTDLILSVGGDGTILRAAQAAIGGKTPIMGINLGRLGFMTELTANEVFDRLPDVIAGEGWIDERTMLEVMVPGVDRTFHALNDIVVARGAIARVVHIEASINEARFTNYTADGVITATATGSTGYSLAAGGPILHPRAREFLLLPLLPHLCLAYILVLPGDSMVKLRVNTPHTTTLSVDGQVNLPVSSGTTITVRGSPYKTRFLRVHPEEYFYTTLEQRLKVRNNVNFSSKSQDR